MDKRNDDLELDTQLEGDYSTDESFTLEAILSEYKGSAFIAGERKTPPSELDEKVNEILRSVTGKAKSETSESAEEPKPEPAPEEERPLPQAQDDDVDEPTRIIDLSAYRKEAKAAPAPARKEKDNILREFEEYEPGDDDAYSEPEIDESIFDNDSDEAVRERYSGASDEAEFPDYDEDEYEPDFEEEITRLTSSLNAYKLRSLAAGVLTVIIAIFTFMYESQAALPFGIGYSTALAAGVIMILGFVTMILGVDVLIRGTEDILTGHAGADTLVLFSCIFTSADGFQMLVTRNYDRGLPFVLISAASVFFAMRGRIAYDKAIADSLKGSLSSNAPLGVISENETDPERDILKKVRGRDDGFYFKLTSKDSGELFYGFLTPILIIFSFIFALIASVGRGDSSSFAHSFGIMTAVCAAFPMAMTYALPFKYVASDLKNAGSAISGWGGACDIADADGTVITDEDVFPAGSVSLSGVKFFEGVNSQKALIDSCSLIISSECGISRIFAELLKSQGFRQKDVDAFTFYEGGGIGGDVDGDHILCGTGAFMNLMGIRVPEKVNLANTVFASVNGELAAVYTVNYVPVNSVQGALRSLLATKVNVLLAVKDFNVTPNIISQKFKVNMDGVEYLPADKIYKVAENENEAPSGVSAVLARDGLGPLAEVISKGKNLKLITELNSIITIGGTLIGLLLMFFLCASGEFGNATCGRAFIFMMIIECCVLLLSQAVRRRA
ncbi:MAG: hypothetical protein II881_03000 [Oscillospiraceae bacterium]|nr:hypothetical protein [Oscillospiraceae bacterium]